MRGYSTSGQAERLLNTIVAWLIVLRRSLRFLALGIAFVTVGALLVATQNALQVSVVDEPAQLASATVGVTGFVSLGIAFSCMLLSMGELLIVAWALLQAAPAVARATFAGWRSRP